MKEVYYVELGDIVSEANPVARTLNVTRLSLEAAARKKILKLRIRQKQKEVEAQLSEKERMCDGFLFLHHALELTEQFKNETAPLRAAYEGIGGEEMCFFVSEGKYINDDFPLIVERIPDDFKTKDALSYNTMSDEEMETFLKGFLRS